jgi:small subunit ribosomal protein S1
MPNSNIPESHPTPESNESFEEIFSQYEKSHARKSEGGGAQQLEGTVVSLTADSVLLDIGFKSEGIIPLTAFGKETVTPGMKFLVTVKGRDPEGYYELVRGKVKRPTDWAGLEKAFAEKSTIVGTVTGMVKGGLSVDVGVRAFMPASRSGARDAAEMQKLVEQEIRCRIIKLDAMEEDVVVDRRIVAEEEEVATKERRYSEVREGETVNGVVRSLMDYGAFVDIGGVDALLHVSDIAWSRVQKPEDVLSVGQAVEVMVLKIDTEKHRISVGLKQLQTNPWDSAVEKYKPGERVRGAITRVADFGAFVELEPGVEGLIHISEMSWAKKVRHPTDLVKPGETVEAVVLGVSASERRISLGLKQTLGDPWAEVAKKFVVGSEVEGPVSSLAKFGAFVQVAEGVEGLVHIGDITAEKRINHPQDVLKVGQRVKAVVLEVDTEKRRLKLGMKQLIPTSIDEYLAERHVGDVVSGRIVEIADGRATVEVGEGIRATCLLDKSDTTEAEKKTESKADLSSLSSMLSARWKGGAGSGPSKPEPVTAGQIRSFKVIKIDIAGKKIAVELA